MYKVGNYIYKSKESYQRLLRIVIIIFAIMLLILTNLKDDMYLLVYIITIIIDIAMIVHLILKYMHSEKKIKYPFNEY